MISKYKLYSISNHLRDNNRSSDQFEIALNALSLEEVIALKLELSSKILNSKRYGFNLCECKFTNNKCSISLMSTKTHKSILNWRVARCEQKITTHDQFLGTQRLRQGKKEE